MQKKPPVLGPVSLFALCLNSSRRVRVVNRTSDTSRRYIDTLLQTSRVFEQTVVPVTIIRQGCRNCQCASVKTRVAESYRRPEAALAMLPAMFERKEGQFLGIIRKATS